ncbi:MAG TPA: isoprenylcysteine carboxylmethyltransferase family protein [Flavobacteriaceae bacterium]|nr:isoprenylcysteine carboxylmethyltransferase family protein [Flavobacteriaceae bacterium]
MKPKTNTTAQDIKYVAIQFLILLLFIVFPNLVYFDFPEFIIWIGIGISVIGFILFIISIVTLGKSLSLYPSPSSKTELVTNGIYSRIRHPIYTGLLLFLLGISIAFAGLIKFILFLAAVILFSKKADYEESRLIKKYPEYKNYQSRTGKLLPKL